MRRFRGSLSSSTATQVPGRSRLRELVTEPRMASGPSRTSVTRSRMALARIAKPSSGYVRTRTGEASAILICSVNVGQCGVCVMTSSPGPNSDSAALYSACFPPAVTMTSDSL